MTVYNEKKLNRKICCALDIIPVTPPPPEPNTLDSDTICVIATDTNRFLKKEKK